METVTISIVALTASTTPSSFVKAIKASPVGPLAIGRVVQWIITPSIADHLLHHNWDFMLVFRTGAELTPDVTAMISQTFSIRITQPVEYLIQFLEHNKSLLHPKSIPPTFNLTNPLVSTSAQRVELTPSLLAFARSNLCPPGPISMLNFVSFRPYAAAKTSYAAYIDAFKEKMGSKRGGVVKMLGDVVERGEWDEMVIAQYPSLAHFADMCADPNYQEMNWKYRLPALRDTAILMTTELQLDWGVEASSKWVQKE